MKFCELNPYKVCNDCGECDICDLNPDKICDNCCKCIDMDDDFASVKIEQVYLDEKLLPKK
jgi:hypothetical protein